MLDTLLESRAHRQHRGGGATLSAAVHLAIVGTVVAHAARHVTSAKPTVDAVKPVVFVVPRAAEHLTSVPARSAPRPLSDVVIRRVDAPVFTPKGLPPIDVGARALADSIVIGGSPGSATDAVGSIFDAQPTTSPRAWDATEVLMHVTTPARPRYPEPLRRAGIEGRVLVEFTVDTTGRVEPGSVRILASTHELFTAAVREALGEMRLRPAEVGGKKTAALADMPFEFRLGR